MNKIMLLIFVMVLCAWFWPNCPKVLKENKKLLLGVFLGFFFTKFMGNIEGLKRKRKRKGERKGKGNKKNPPSPIPVLNNHLDDYCASYLIKGDSDDLAKLNKNKKLSAKKYCQGMKGNCILKGKFGDYLLPDNQIDPEQVSEWQSKWRDIKLPGAQFREKEYGIPVNITSYRERREPSLRILCNPSNPDFMFQNTDKYLNRKGKSICRKCYSYPN